MKLLTFQAKRFWWRSFSKTLDEVEDVEVEEDVRDAVVAFYQIETGDEENSSSCEPMWQSMPATSIFGKAAARR